MAVEEPALPYGDPRVFRVATSLHYLYWFDLRWRFHQERMGSVNEAGAPPDLTVVIALMEATWVRARGLIEFFIGPKRGRIHISDFMTRWSLPKELRERLRGYAKHISHHLVHILEVPEGDGGYSGKMAGDVFEAFELFVVELERRDSEFATGFRQALDRIEWERKQEPTIKKMVLAEQQGR
jgi:hypothetical protein